MSDNSQVGKKDGNENSNTTEPEKKGEKDNTNNEEPEVTPLDKKKVSIGFSKITPGPTSGLVTFKNWIISPIFLLFIIFIIWLIASSYYLNTIDKHYDDDEPYMSDLYLGVFLTTIILIVLYLIFNLDRYSLLFIFFSLFILVLNYILTYFWLDHFKGHKDRIIGLYVGILLISIFGIITYIYVFFFMKEEEKSKFSKILGLSSSSQASSKISSISDEIKFINNSNRLVSEIDTQIFLNNFQTGKEPEPSSDKHKSGFKYKESEQFFDKNFSHLSDKVEIKNKDIRKINNDRKIYYRPKTGKLGLDRFTSKVEKFIEDSEKESKKRRDLIQKSGENIYNTINQYQIDTINKYESKVNESNLSMADINRITKEYKDSEKVVEKIRNQTNLLKNAGKTDLNGIPILTVDSNKLLKEEKEKLEKEVDKKVVEKQLELNKSSPLKRKPKVLSPTKLDLLQKYNLI